MLQRCARGNRPPVNIGCPSFVTFAQRNVRQQMGAVDMHCCRREKGEVVAAQRLHSADVGLRPHLAQRNMVTYIRHPRAVGFISVGKTSSVLTVAMLRTKRGLPPPLFSCRTTSDPGGSRSAPAVDESIASPIMCRASRKQSEGDRGDISMVGPILRNAVTSYACRWGR